MTTKSTTWWRGQIPTAVLVLIIAALALWAIGTGVSAAPGVAPMDVLKGVVLIVVGFFAGLLGGLIGTGGCSVMLPIIHFWMGYPAAIAVGTTLFAVIFTALSGGYGHLVQRNVDVRAFAWLGGGGHIGRPLAEMARVLNYDVRLVDVREERGTPLDPASVTAQTFIVLITEDYVSDEAALRAIIESPAPYIGMIGSRRKCRMVLEHLRADGVADNLLARVRAPIGLDLRDHTRGNRAGDSRGNRNGATSGSRQIAQ